MNIKESTVGNAHVLELKGELLGGPDMAEFSTKIKSLLAGGKKNLVVDLSKVTYVNSSGIGMLIAGYTSAKTAGGSLKIAGAEKSISNTFVLTTLVKVFETHDTAAEAAASFK
jgi:anti-sigma B factor antagonist